MREPDLTGPGYADRVPVFGTMKAMPTAAVFNPIAFMDAIKAALTDADRAGWRAWLSRTDLTELGPSHRAPWVIHAPGSHGIWPWCVIYGVSLADFPDHTPAFKKSPDMTHEISVWPLIAGSVQPSSRDQKPRRSAAPDPDDRKTWCGVFQPQNLVVQIPSFTDEALDELMRQLARGFVTGLSSPDSDYCERNRDLVLGTADHLREGRHMPQ